MSIFVSKHIDDKPETFISALKKFCYISIQNTIQSLFKTYMIATA